MDEKQRNLSVWYVWVAVVGLLVLQSVLALTTYEAPRQSLFLDLPAPPKREYSEATARLIDQEVRRLLDEARARVLKTLPEQKSALETLARMLMEHEVVDGAELRRLLGVIPDSRAAEPLTATSGSLEGSRIVRGREAECESFYGNQPLRQVSS